MLVTGAVYLSICLLCPKFPQFIHPSSHLSLSLFCNRRLQPWKGACEMPVIHNCDSGWAMGLSCSRAPAEAQFPFVLWCIDPFRPPLECAPLMLTLLKTSLCHLPLMLINTQQPETASAKPKDSYFHSAVMSNELFAPVQPLLLLFPATVISSVSFKLPDQLLAWTNE